jgi:hypothetical protein
VPQDETRTNTQKNNNIRFIFPLFEGKVKAKAQKGRKKPLPNEKK